MAGFLRVELTRNFEFDAAPPIYTRWNLNWHKRKKEKIRGDRHDSGKTTL
jgi:hypothetical protein